MFHIKETAKKVLKQTMTRVIDSNVKQHNLHEIFILLVICILGLTQYFDNRHLITVPFETLQLQFCCDWRVNNALTFSENMYFDH